MAFRTKEKVREQAGDALNQAKANQQELSALRRQISRQRMLLQAFWQLAHEKLELTEAQLQEVVDGLDSAEKNQPRVADLCPQCGRSLQDNRPRCIYCDHEVQRKELF
jgi:hypothetical protein